MASTKRPSRGRDTPSSRTVARIQRSSSKSADATAILTHESQSVPKTTERRSFRVTKRAMAFFGVLVVLFCSYVNTLRVFFSTERDISATRQEIVTRQSHIDDLQDELARWEDPEYVKTQARARLGWVLPGEIGYQVIGPDGKLFGETEQITEDENLPPGEYSGGIWFEKMWGTIRTADDPQPKKPEPTTITAPEEEPR